MALVDAATWKTFATWPDSTLDAFLSLVCPQVDAAIRIEINRPLIEQKSGLVEYLDGNGKQDLYLKYFPVQAVAEVREDQGGAYGSAAGAFDSTTILTAGVDYVLVPDDPLNPGWSRRGKLSRIGSVWQNTFRRSPQRLSVLPCPLQGSVMVTYTAGLTASGIPPLDLQLAACEMVSQVKIARKYGWPVTSEGLGEYHYQIGILIQNALQAGSVQAILAKYRVLVEP